MKFPFFAALAALLFLGTGCAGYHIGASVPQKMVGVKTVAVPTFRNETLVPRLEVLAASTLVKQFQQDGTLEVRAPEDADVIVEGTIKRIYRRGARSVRSDIVNYTVTRRGSKEILDTATVAGDTTFFVSGNDVNQDERQAIPLAIEKVSANIVSRITTGW